MEVVMCRFFFDVMDQGSVVRRDLHGREMPGLDAAEIEASVAWKELSQEWGRAGRDFTNLVVLVYDEIGTLLASMPPSLKVWRAEPSEQVAA